MMRVMCKEQECDQVYKVKVCCEHALGLWLEDLLERRHEGDESDV